MSGWCSTPSVTDGVDSHARCRAGNAANPDKEWAPCPCSCHLAEEYECACGRPISLAPMWNPEGEETYVHINPKTGVARIKAEAVQVERARALVLMEAVLARVRCEAVHRQTNGGRCVNCILWAKNVGAPKYLAHARGEG